MMHGTLQDVAIWCGGQLHGSTRMVRGVVSDSRQLSADALFVAIRGERVDGHDFLAQATAAGAAGALVERLVDVPLAQIVVADCTLALGQIAARWLQQCAALRIGLTGSNGKTTVKTLTQSILSQVDGRTYANPGNRNNELGLPLAALELHPAMRFAIFEMGAGKPGDIQYLCDIARPQIALVNNVAAAHLERLGTLEGVAQTKAAIYQALPADGIAVINLDDAFAPLFKQLAGARRVLGFALDAEHADAVVRASDLRVDGNGTDFTLWLNGAEHPARIQLIGTHNVRNALAAAALALAAGANAQQIVAGLALAVPVSGRLQTQRTATGVDILDDSYNANPGSFAAGMQTLRATAKHAWVVMGDMAELGPQAAQLHAQMGVLARELGMERLYAVGPLSASAVAAAGDIGRHFASVDALNHALATELAAGVTVLVKGSRSSGMERVVAFLKSENAPANAHAHDTAGTGVHSC